MCLVKDSCSRLSSLTACLCTSASQTREVLREFVTVIRANMTWSITFIVALTISVVRLAPLDSAGVMVVGVKLIAIACKN